MQRWICRHRENKQRSLVFSCLCNRNTIVHLHSVYNDTPVFVTVIVTLSQLCADVQFFVKRPRISLSPVSDKLCRQKYRNRPSQRIENELQWCTDGNNILYSSQREIKAVVRSYTLTHNEELNCTYLNKLCAIQFFIVS